MAKLLMMFESDIGGYEQGHQQGQSDAAPDDSGSDADDDH